MARALLLLSLLLAGPASARQPFRVNQDPGRSPQQEPTVAAGGPLDLAIAYKDWRTGSKRIAISRSRDGGRSFTDSLLGFGGHAFAEQSDPWLAAGRDGRFHLAALFYRDPVSGGSGIFVASSGGKGEEFGEPVAVALAEGGDQVDKGAVAADDTGGARDGTIYVAWVALEDADGDGMPDTSRIRLSRSRDGGARFEGPVTVSDGTRNHGPVPVVLPGGEVVVLWVRDLRAGTTALLCDRSLDGGESFGRDVAAAGIVAAGRWNPLSGFRELAPGFRITVLPSAAADRSRGPHRGSLYAAWTDGREGDADVLLVRSRDGGRTFTPPVRVNGDRRGNGRDQFLPAVAVDALGRVHVVWLDRRDDPGNLKYHLVHAVSSDGGESFAGEARVTEVPSDPGTDFGGRLLGDYLGIASVGEGVVAAWCDTSRGDQDIRAASLGGGAARALAPEASLRAAGAPEGEGAPAAPSPAR